MYSHKLGTFGAYLPDSRPAHVVTTASFFSCTIAGLVIVSFYYKTIDLSNSQEYKQYIRLRTASSERWLLGIVANDAS